MNLFKNMKQILTSFCILHFAFCICLHAQTSNVTVTAKSDGTLRAPTNFFGANITLLTNALETAGYTSGDSTNDLNLRLLQTGTDLTNLIETVGNDATNYTQAAGTEITNRIATVGSEATNYTQASGTAITNRLLTLGSDLTNRAAVIGSDATNYTQAAGTAITNRIATVGSEATNYAIAISNILASMIGSGGGGGPSVSNNIPYTATFESDGTNVFFNATNGTLFILTLTNNCRLRAPTNEATDGQVITFRLKQDGTGNRIAYPIAATNGTKVYNWKFGSDITAFSQTTNANAIDYIRIIYDASSTNWHVVANTIGY